MPLHHQYLEMQYASTPANTSTDDSLSLPTVVQTKSSGSSMNYGVKRVLAVPRQVVCTPPTSYNVYGMPPVKIIAGNGGQRMVTRTVSGTELQYIPKTQI